MAFEAVLVDDEDVEPVFVVFGTVKVDFFVLECQIQAFVFDIAYSVEGDFGVVFHEENWVQVEFFVVVDFSEVVQFFVRENVD